MIHNKAFTLIELSLAVVLSAILAGALVPNYVRSLHIEAARKTALEMSQIAEAGRVYYIEHNDWPQDLQALKTAGALDPAWEGRGPFGKLYGLHPDGANLEVKSEVLPSVAAVVAGLLPMATVQGNEVDMTVTPPGAVLAAIPTGAIISWTSTVIPGGWLVCDGRVVSREDQAALFAVIGTTYGAGDGATTFALPDLRGRTVVGTDNMGGSAANVITGAWARNIGGRFGEENHQLTIAEMPAHAHGLGSGLGPNGSGRGELEGTYNNAHIIDHAKTSSSIGGNGMHNTIQPSIALIWIIRA